MNAHRPNPGALARDQQTGAGDIFIGSEGPYDTPEARETQQIPEIIRRHFTAAELAGVS